MNSKLHALVAGPVAAALVYFILPDTYIGIDGVETPFQASSKAVIAALVWMAIWWFLEAVHVAITGLLPLVLFPLFAIIDVRTTAAAYGSHIIFLLLGGFIIGLSMQRWGLDRRVALLILSLMGDKPGRLVFGFMLICAVLSAFISNTATTAMMLPIAVNVVALLEQQHREGVDARPFAVCTMLGIAYAASLGGIMTLIGTAPNAFASSFIQDTFGDARAVGFADWLFIALPITLVMVPLTWLVLTRVVFRLPTEPIAKSREILKQQLHALPPIERGGWITLAVFALVVVLWMTRPLLQGIEITLASGPVKPLAGLSDAGIAMLAAMLLFTLPAGGRRFTMDWDTAKRLPWEIVLLFGGGIALARAIKANGVDAIIGAQAAVLGNLPEFVIILAIAGLVVFLTEFTSNTATTTALVPIFAALAAALGLDPIPVTLATAMAASCAFMMPVATPPNAIVFGSGYVRMHEMIRAGFVLNLLVIPVVAVVAWYWARVVLAP
ncbi:MAG: SLC13 family permease [Gammaproteobacteria bacterium]|nr:SLC13 family permease [Gammaproteobacteria bacterium]MDD9886318.1 SLC13 family permease [Gammaproteobacteria bacterium]